MTQLKDAIDGSLFSGLKRIGQKPAHRPVIDAVKDYTSKNQGPIPADRVHEIAVRVARDELILEGKKQPTTEQINARAYLGAAIAGVEQPFTIAEDTRAPAKAEHYFLSGAISSRVASWLPFLPEKARHWVGFQTSHAIGVVKEVADAIKGTGYKKEDIKTDDAGSRRALKP
ncbi:hypothetical protein J7643_10735 [bacterium]|nr:hypothetical protein [bacterium]